MDFLRKITGPPTGHERTAHIAKHFYSIWLFSVGIGIVAMAMIGVVVGREGFGWKDNPDKIFSYHPLFMTIGIIFLTGQSVVLYRVFPYANHNALKTAHATMHAITFILVVTALTAVFHFEAYIGNANLNEVHGWMGLVTVLFFSTQFVVGFLMFVLPGGAEPIRVWYLDYHRYFGLVTFLIACCTGCTGMTLYQVTGWSHHAVFCRIFVLAVIVYAICIAHLMSGRVYETGKVLGNHNQPHPAWDSSTNANNSQRAVDYSAIK